MTLIKRFVRDIFCRSFVCKTLKQGKKTINSSFRSFVYHRKKWWKRKKKSVSSLLFFFLFFIKSLSLYVASHDWSIVWSKVATTCINFNPLMEMNVHIFALSVFFFCSVRCYCSDFDTLNIVCDCWFVLLTPWCALTNLFHKYHARSKLKCLWLLLALNNFSTQKENLYLFF